MKFRELDGVVDTAVGYEGGDVENPTYEQVCRGDTGHVEVVRVEYDPAQVDYEDLVQKYFEIHDPTQLNRQGPDVGSQYRSVIFTEDAEQAEAAQRVLDANRDRFRKRDRHRDHAGEAVLARRGVPPVLPLEAPDRRRAAEPAARPVGDEAAGTNPRAGGRSLCSRLRGCGSDDETTSTAGGRRGDRR